MLAFLGSTSELYILRTFYVDRAACPIMLDGSIMGTSVFILVQVTNLNQLGISGAVYFVSGLHLIYAQNDCGPISLIGRGDLFPSCTKNGS